MSGRVHPAWLAVGSALLLAGLVGALYWTAAADRPAGGGRPLYVFCAEALRAPMEAIAKDYEAEVGRKVFLNVGPSQAILAGLKVSGKGDLFLPADESYVQLAREQHLVSDALPLARMRAVVAVRPKFPTKITSWADLTAPGVRIGLANPAAAAIGKLLKARLEEQGRWADLAARQPKELLNVNDVANAAALGSIDAGVVWDVTARLHPALTVVEMPELDGVTARVQVGLARASGQPEAALRLARYLRAPGKGGHHFRAAGFDVSDDGNFPDED